MNRSNTNRIIVLGGGYAGVKAALRLSRKLRHQPLEVVLINGADHFVERVRLHQVASNQPIQKVAIRSILRGTGVRFVQGWATQIAPEQSWVTVQTADGVQRITYDKLVYAAGSYIDTSIVPGAAEYALSLSTEATTLQLRSRLPEIAARGGRVVVAGGGLTGIEAAAEIAAAYPTLQVTLVTRGTFGEQVSAKGREHLRRVFGRLNIPILDHTAITQVTAEQVVYDGGATPYDVCLWAAAFTVPALAREAGLQVNARGQVIVDPHLRSVSHPDIYAIGDAAGLEAALDVPIRMACATALPMAAYVGDHIAATLRGEPTKPYQFSYILRCISLGRHDGLIQMVERDDTPREQIITGRLAAQIKEMVVRFAFANVKVENWLSGGAKWTGARNAHPSPGQAQANA